MEIFTSWAERAERSLILRLLNLRVGKLPDTELVKVENLSIERLEALGEALLDFTSLTDLQNWLSSNSV